MNQFMVQYFTILDASLYTKVDKDRLDNPKFIFRETLKILSEKNDYLKNNCYLLDL